MKEYSVATTLCFIAFHILSIVKENQGTKLIDSLQCYNNFRSYVNCTWEENDLSRLFVNMNLYRLTSNGAISVMEDCHHIKTLSGLVWTCYSNIEDIFYIGYDDKYTFLPDNDLKSHIDINLTSKVQCTSLLQCNGCDTVQKEEIQPIMYVSEEGYFIRWTDDPYNFSTSGVLDCEVSYKQESSPWEDSYKIPCKSSWGVIARDRLSPSLKYVARMRVKSWLNKESWSNWSSEVLLSPGKKVNLTDEVKPQNLRCMNLTCLWETRLELSNSINFALFYKQNQSQELECRSSCQEVAGIPYLSCYCHIPSKDSNMLMVTVRPKPEIKEIKPCLNIRAPPRLLTVEEQGDAYRVSWNKEDIISDLWLYQVCYGQEKFPLKETSLDCERTINHTGSPERLFFLNQHLRPSTMYYMKVRMRVDQNNPKSCYNGPWSEWSNIKRWKTKSVVQLHLIYILISICAIIFIVCFTFGSKVLKRSKKQWEDRIPDPGKCTFIEDILQKGSILRWKGAEYAVYEELIDLCSPVTIEKDPKDLMTSEKDTENCITSEMEQMDEDDSCEIFPGIFEEDDVNSTVVVSGYKPFADLVNDSTNKNQMETQFQNISFNGPYIFCPAN